MQLAAQTKNYTSHVKFSRSGNIFLITGGQDKAGYDAWYYIQVDQLKISLFQKSVKMGSVKLDEFGKVLESGFGKLPSEEVKKKMKEKYNFVTE